MLYKEIFDLRFCFSCNINCCVLYPEILIFFNKYDNVTLRGSFLLDYKGDGMKKKVVLVVLKVADSAEIRLELEVIGEEVLSANIFSNQDGSPICRWGKEFDFKFLFDMGFSPI